MDRGVGERQNVRERLDGAVGDLRRRVGTHQPPRRPVEFAQRPFAVRPARDVGGRHRVLDALGQRGVLIDPPVLPEVIRDARGDGFACELLAAPAGKEDTRQVGVTLADRVEELETVPIGEVGVADDAVDVRGVESCECVRRGRLGEHAQRVALPFERGGGEFVQVRVVDVAGGDRPPAASAVVAVRGVVDAHASKWRPDG